MLIFTRTCLLLKYRAGAYTTCCDIDSMMLSSRELIIPATRRSFSICICGVSWINKKIIARSPKVCVVGPIVSWVKFIWLIASAGKRE